MVYVFAPKEYTQPPALVTPVVFFCVRGKRTHRQNGLSRSVCVRKAAGSVVGQLGKLRPIVNRPNPEGTPRVPPGQRR